jgi:hypothetical protein
LLANVGPTGIQYLVSLTRLFSSVVSAKSLSVFVVSVSWSTELVDFSQLHYNNIYKIQTYNNSSSGIFKCDIKVRISSDYSDGDSDFEIAGDVHIISHLFCTESNTKHSKHWLLECKLQVVYRLSSLHE